MSSKLQHLKQEISKLVDEEKAIRDLRFFKTAKGEYAEGDRFLGIAVPQMRKLGKKYNSLELSEIRELLYSPYNEERLLGLLILVGQFERSKEASKKRAEIYDFYVKHMERVNNWNLVDLSARPIIGGHLIDKSRDVLREWAKSESLWVRRIAIVATYHFIKEGEFEDTLQIATILLDDKEDLIHKAVGWMLRELGKRDEAVLKNFLRSHYTQMPRTMLRYAIERLSLDDREVFMKR